MTKNNEIVWTVRPSTKGEINPIEFNLLNRRKFIAQPDRVFDMAAPSLEDIKA